MPSLIRNTPISIKALHPKFPTFTLMHNSDQKTLSP